MKYIIFLLKPVTPGCIVRNFLYPGYFDSPWGRTVRYGLTRGVERSDPVLPGG